MAAEDVLDARVSVNSRLDTAAEALYRAELAVHDAHQSHVDSWIRAANDHLHEAMLEYREADAALLSS